MSESTYKELRRLKITECTTITLSEVYRGQELRGFSLSKHVDNSEYTGYSRGIFIPKNRLGEFLIMLEVLKNYSPSEAGTHAK